MKSHTHYLILNLPSKMGFLNITSEVEKALVVSGVRDAAAIAARFSAGGGGVREHFEMA